MLSERYSAVLFCEVLTGVNDATFDSRLCQATHFLAPMRATPSAAILVPPVPATNIVGQVTHAVYEMR